MKPNVTTKEATAMSYFRWLLALMLVFAALCLYQPHKTDYSVFNRTWGFDHVVFYGQQVQIFIFAVALTLIIPFTNAFVSKYISLAVFKAAELRKLKTPLFIFLSLLSVVLFYMVRVKYYFLGDFNLRLDQVMKKDFLTNEYLTMKLLYYFSMLGIKQGFTAYQMFAYYSCIMGGIFIFLCLLIADLLGKDSLQKFFFFLAQVGTAMVLVFCGYIEIYATPIVFLFLYLYAGLRYIKTNSGFYFVLISFGFAVFSHLLSLAVAPTLAALWYFNHRKSFGFITSISNTRLTLTLLILSVVALIVALSAHTGLTLPMTAPKRGYITLFSFKHFWEFFNGELLACGLSFIMLPFLLIKIARQKIVLSDATYFLLFLSACMLFVVALLNFHRGSGDWDLMALPAISLNLLTVVLVTTMYAHNLSLKNYLLLVIVGINVLQAWLWINVNHTDKSIAKIDTMLTNDPGTYYTKMPSLLQLGIIYDVNKLLPQAINAGERACNDHRFNDIRSCMFYAKKLIANKQREQAVPVIEGILFISPYTVELYFYLMQYYQEIKKQQEFYNVLNRLFNAYQQQVEEFIRTSTPVQNNSFTEAFKLLLKAETGRGVDSQRIQAIQTVLARLDKKLKTGV